MFDEWVLRSRRVIAGGSLGPADIAIRGGTITAVGAPRSAPASPPVVDVGDLAVIPGVVDTHVHVNEPGRTEWEGFASATRAAAAGGVTTIVDMPLNSVPATTSVRALEQKRAALAGQISVDVGLWGGAVPGNAGELVPLLRAGALGFKCFLVDSGVDEFPPLDSDDAAHRERRALIDCIGEDMRGYGIETYGDRVADIYDELYTGLGTDAAVAALAELAGPGPVLELGIGTGRVALPLRARSLEVHGIEASQAMIARLRAKAGGGDIPVTMGDFADVAVAESYQLVFVVFNTFFALLTQADQIRCFANVAARLLPGGRFVIEAFVPDPTLYQRGQAFTITGLDADGVSINASRHDPIEQRVWGQHVIIDGRGTRLVPIELRYAWPSELDLMARLAGLELRERRGGWEPQPLTATSGRHVSIYEKPGR